MFMKLSEIKSNPNNPRLIKDASFRKLVRSLKELPIMANKLRKVVVDENNVILGGNMRFKALKEAGLKEVHVEYFTREDADENNRLAKKLDPEYKYKTYEEQCREFIIKDNVSGGEWDWDIIANEWDAEELDEWGLDLPDSFGEEQEVEEDEAPEVDETEPPKSKLGEIYQLGRHRVMCGDSTDFGSITDLLDGAAVNTIFTDPPYGMNAVSKSGVLSKTYKTDIIGDDDNTIAIKAFEVTRPLEAKHEIWWGANYYSTALPSSECWVVWNKNNGGSDQTDAELAWGNMRSVVRMFTQSSEKVNRVHPTQKPVELPAWAFNQFKCGDNVLDLFLGSGSTLIACEQTDRTCYGMELDPKYVDVIRKRYAKFIQPDNQLPENWEELTPAIN